MVEHVLALTQYLYNTYNADNIPVDPADLILAIEAEFNTLGGGSYDADLSLTNISIGSMIQHPDVGQPNKRMPDYLTWTLTDAVSTDEFQIRIWFHDASFQAQYDEYEIVIVPPIVDIEDFNDSSTSNVSALLAAQTTETLINRIETAKNGQPTTKLKTVNLTWTNPTNQVSTLNTTWTLLIYGLAGDQLDNIEAALIDALEATAVPLLTWEDIFPQLFAANEFYVIPFWDQIAIEWMIATEGLYSPVMNIQRITPVAEQFAVGYQPADIAVATSVVPTFYKSVTLLTVGNIQNEGGEIRIEQRYTDIINVPTSSLDFNRMSPTTQGMINFIMSLLEVAETATPVSVIPVQFSKLNRSGFLYITGRYDDTNFIVLTKHSFPPSP
jgi:hypothetical protein